jgi:hypothetical protein
VCCTGSPWHYNPVFQQGSRKKTLTDLIQKLEADWLQAKTNSTAGRVVLHDDSDSDGFDVEPDQPTEVIDSDGDGNEEHPVVGVEEHPGHGGAVAKNTSILKAADNR